VCIREPLQAVSSQLSSLQPATSFFGTDPAGEGLPRLFRHYYERWFRDLELFARHGNPLVIDQEWMARYSDEVLDQIYARLGRCRPENVTAPSAAAATHRHDPGRYHLHRESLDVALWEAYSSLSQRAQPQR
jgi:hypothetical protein